VDNPLVVNTEMIATTVNKHFIATSSMCETEIVFNPLYTLGEAPYSGWKIREP
jgi:hypothetical protein